jgi:RHS repeat-associated protein
MDGTAVHFTETHLKDLPIDIGMGNTRVVFGYKNNALLVKQVSSYYPFGMNIKGLTTQVTIEEAKHPANEYLYNGKMFQDELGLDWLDYGARMYDAVLGRWHTVDQMAHLRESLTPYNYCSNNPITRIDPDGALDGDFFDRQGNYLGTDGVEDGKVYVLNEGLRAKTENTIVNWGGTFEEKHVTELKSKSEEIKMDSDLGYMIRAVYAEMRSGEDNAKIIVAESIKNRTERKVGSYENPDGTYKGAISVPGAYSITNTNDKANDSYVNPQNHIYNNPKETTAWRNSTSAALKVHFGLSGNIGNGVTTYNSSSSTLYDNNKRYEKIQLDITHKGIKGLWRIK